MNGSARDFGRELYPFLYDAPPQPAAALQGVLAEVRRSTLQKCEDVIALRRQILADHAARLVQAAVAMAAAFAAGGKLLAFGNGGSATDAQDAAADCMLPAFPYWRALPALALTSDVAVVTAVGNDVGFENVFSRQIIALGERGDVALGISTSGSSPNVLAAFAEAKRRGLLTIGLAGYDGGATARAGAVDFCFVARLEHVPRIQEGQATIWHALLELVQESLAARGVAEARA
ncbi:MAG: SIS domain-containing protein [Gemmatimonadota bacterium]